MTGSRDVETEYAWSMFLIEKETGAVIGPTYPVSKFLVQVEMLNRYYKEQQKAYGSSGKKTLG